jgi:hypothetical protein
MNAIRNHICTQPASVRRSTLALAVLALLAVTSPALAVGRNPKLTARGESHQKSLATRAGVIVQCGAWRWATA